MTNKHIQVLPTSTSYRMNYVLKSSKVSCFTQTHGAANSYQLDSWWLFCPGSRFWMP